MTKSIASLALCSAALFATACTDGSDEPEELTAPVLELELAPVKQLELSWDPVAAALSYQVFERLGLNGEPTPLAPESEALSLRIEIPLHFQTNKSYLVRACDASRCLDSAALSPSGLLGGIGYIKASTARSAARFGSSISLSADGSLLAVGAPNESSETGAVYLLRRDGEFGWIEEARLQAANAGEGDRFGDAIAIDPSGAFVLIGAPEEDGGEDGTTAKSDSGAAYLFARGELDESTGLASWSTQAYIKAPNYDLSNLKINDRFGAAVALDAGAATLAIGADKEGQQGGSGAVYLYARGEAGWEHHTTLKAPSPDEDDEFGASIALSVDGSTLAVGAPYEDSEASGVGGDDSSDAALDSGAAYVFTREMSDAGTLAWNATPIYLKASNTSAGANFGQVSLDASGTLLAVGAPNPEAIGSAYVFELDPDAAEGWSERLVLVDPGPDGARDQFGAALALSGDGETLVVAAPEDDSAAVGIDGDQTDIAAFRAGAARVFRASTGLWSAGLSPATGVYLKATNSDKNDEFGRAVAISESGASIALGALAEDASDASDASDNGRSNAGAVYLF